MSRLTPFILLAAVNLGAGFGSASAEVVSLSDQSMEVEVQVEVQNSSDAVVVHFALAGEDPVTLPLVSRGEAMFGITTELKPANYQVIFETLGDPSIQSLPVTLIDLGAEISESPGPATSTTESGISAATEGWGWLALAFGAASLAVLAFWALGGTKENDEVVSEPGSDPTAVDVEPAVDDQPSTGSTPDV
jgi:hypothetical protein